MKTIYSDNTTVVLRLDKGEEVFWSLLNFCTENTITSGYFSAIGAAQEILLSFYNLKEKTYEDHLISEHVEIATVTGNVAEYNGQPVIHAHGIFAKKDMTTVGGHVKSILISATCEIVLHKLDTILKREKNEEIGLNLLV